MIKRSPLLILLTLFLYLLSFTAVIFPRPANAVVALCFCLTFSGCEQDDCDDAEEAIEDENEAGMDTILIDNDNSDTEDVGDDYNGQFNDFETWIMNFSREQVIPALQRMTRQLGAVAMDQMFILGTFFDAELQLGTQRLFQKLTVEAHRDYQPSEDFCWFGTGVRSMASTEARSRYLTQGINARQMARHLGNRNQSAAGSKDLDKRARWDKFTTTYCDPQDNHWNGTDNSGLVAACGNDGGGNSERINLDIDYTRLIDAPRTLLVNFSDSTDRQDIYALGNNLYGHDVLTRDLATDYLQNEAYQGRYLELRGVAARRSVAENSFNAIVELKAAGTSDVIRPPPEESEEPKTREFLAAILTEMGISEDEVYDYIGERPSYYAQLELLAKKIYQNPDFYANLYDKPANVQRKSVALKAIELMLDRAIYESQLRREMATSVLLATKLRTDIKNANEVILAGEK